MMLINLTTGDFYFDYLVKVVSAMFSPKLLFSPLQLISILWEVFYDFENIFSL